MSDRLLMAEDVADRLNVPVSWVYAAARRGQFPSVKNGRYVRFRPEDVETWIRNGGQGVEE